MKTKGIFAAGLFMLVVLAGIAWAEEDVEGSKDPSFLTRMPNFNITVYDEKDFDSHEFEMGERSVTVEGHKYSIEYMIREGAQAPSELQVARNYTNAVKKIGGSVVYEDQGSKRAVMKIARDGKEVWVEVSPQDGAAAYNVVVVEKRGMAQEVAANDILDALNRDGRVTLYINFDTGKSSIKPDSQKVIDQIAEMLTGNPDLNISVEGHTDNVGNAKSNKTLSEERSKAVVAALVKLGVDVKRLSSAGFGQDRPIADNKTEEGRAKNRRVELVKK